MWYLAGAFIAVWLLVTVYVVFMGVRQRQLAAEIRELEALVNEQPGSREQAT